MHCMCHVKLNKSNHWHVIIHLMIGCLVKSESQAPVSLLDMGHV